MPESRDRLSRPIDISFIFSHRRTGPLGIYQDQPELEMAPFGSPVPRAARTVAAVAGQVGMGRGGFLATPVSQRGRARNLRRTPATATGRENTPAAMGRGRGSRSVLPYWYPRIPLQDITAVVRAIERRRERLGGGHGLEIGSPIPLALLDPSEPPPVAHLEHGMSPAPTLGVKRCPPSVGKVPKILLDITNKPSGDSEFLTPQKKLLNSIDTVEKVVMEELRKLKRTPSAKKAEREKRVRTLMSMR